MTTRLGSISTRWAPLLALTAILAACGRAVAPDPDPAPPAPPAPTERQATCDDSAIRLLERAEAEGVHGAIVADTLHLGGATAPATCTDPTNESLQPGLSLPDGRTAQVQQSEYYLIVIRYTSGNRLYVISRRGDGTSCVVDTNDNCVAEVTDLPDDFDLDDLPDDVERTIPAGRPAPPTPSPPAGGDDTPPVASPPPATGPPGAAGSPQPANGATGVPVDAPLLTWAAVPGAVSYDVHWSGFGEPTQTAGVTIASTFVRMSARESTHVVGGSPSTRLAPNTTYYWRVDAKSAYTRGCPPSSCTQGRFWSFTTGSAQPAVSPPPTAPNPPPGASRPSGTPQPQDGATGVTVDAPLLSWAAVPGALSYDVHWDNFQSYQTAAITTTSTSVRMSARSSTRAVGGSDTRLAPNTTYYWRVDAKRSGTLGCLPSSCTIGDYRSFTTGPASAGTPPPATGPPRQAVTNPRPPHGATGVRVDAPAMSWVPVPGATSYDVHWADDASAITSGLTTPVNTTSTSDFTMSARRSNLGSWTGDLDAETTYYWRVDAKNEDGATTGAVWSFTTGQPSPPEEEPEEETLPDLRWVRPRSVEDGYNWESCFTASLRDCVRWEYAGIPIRGDHFNSNYLPYISFPRAAPGSGPSSLSYSLSPEIPGLTFNSTLRRLRGTPTSDALDDGQTKKYTMTYAAKDADGRTLEATIAFYVQKRWYQLHPQAFEVE